MTRPIVHTIPVGPRLAVAVEDSHNILLLLTKPNGTEITRTDVITNVDHLVDALDSARVWIQMEEAR